MNTNFPDLGNEYIIDPIERSPIEVFLAHELKDSRDWGHTPLGIATAFEQGHTGEGVKVAVLDTGADWRHPDLEISTHTDNTNSRYGSLDVNGHGSHCIGIIAAKSNDRGLIGVAPNATVLSAKVLGDNGSGRSDWIVRGGDWAVNNGAEVISMSLGSSQPDHMIRQGIKRWVDAGVIVVVAAGNSGPGNIDYPGAFPEPITVGAINSHLRVAPFSSTYSEVDVAAPGVEINSTLPGGRYGTMSGTSMACPYVAGIMVLCKAAAKKAGVSFNQLDALHLIRKHCRDLEEPGRDNKTGWGLPRVMDMLGSFGKPTPPPPPPPVDPRPSIRISLKSGDTVPPEVEEITLQVRAA